MTKGKILIGILLTITLLSCGTTEPTSYNNIKGSWRCTETSDQGSHSFIVDVYRLKADTTIYLFSNFHNVTIDDTGDIRIKQAGNKISIESAQSIPSTPIVVKSGTGTVSSNFMEMEMDYNVFDGQRDIAVHAVFTR